MPNKMNLECSWGNFVDYNGLNQTDRQRIKEVGFRQWLEEITGKRKAPIVVLTIPKAPAIAQPAKLKGVGGQLAQEFFRIAQANNNIVTYEQATQLCPAYPGDPAAWAREAGATVRTERKNRRYVVERYS